MDDPEKMMAKGERVGKAKARGQGRVMGDAEGDEIVRED